MKIERRKVLWMALTLPAAIGRGVAADAGPDTVRGKLVRSAGKPALETPAGVVVLEGEPETLAVLGDERLSGADLEFKGQYAGAAAPRNRFRIGPFFESKSMFVHRAGKRYTISYWCEICSIRTYTPGKCMCCQEETEIKFEEFPPR